MNSYEFCPLTKAPAAAYCDFGTVLGDVFTRKPAAVLHPTTALFKRFFLLLVPVKAFLQIIQPIYQIVNLLNKNHMVYCHIKHTDKGKNEINRKYSNKEFITAKPLSLSVCVEEHKAPYNYDDKHHNREKSEDAEEGGCNRNSKFVISHKCQLIYSAVEGTVSKCKTNNVCNYPQNVRYHIYV